MKTAARILLILGLCHYGLGLLSNIFNSFFDILSHMPSDAGVGYHTRYLLLTSLSVLIQLGIGGLVAFFTLRFLKKPLRKKAVFMVIISGAVMLWSIIFTVLSFTPAIPQYLIKSKMGLIDTYIAYLLPILKNGTPFMFLGSLLILIGGLMEIFKKRKQNL